MITLNKVAKAQEALQALIDKAVEQRESTKSAHIDTMNVLAVQVGTLETEINALSA